MIQFREKKFTLQEGHFTGSKDLSKVPGAVEVIGKSALGGALAGTAVGAILKDSTALEGALEGTKWGALAGVILKFFLNYLHNPMTRVKYQDVDRAIRREFGIYRASGFTVGDTVKKRASLDEKFGFNDRKVTSYKLNFSIQDDQLTMYTYGVTENELEKINNILDYYCKKYSGMSYDSALINQKMNSYAAHIVFTNNQVIANFIMELSGALETKINLLDNKAVVMNKLSNEEEERDFSVKGINRFDLINIIGKTCLYPITLATNWKESISYTLMGFIETSIKKLGMNELSKNMNLAMPKEAFGNKYLEDTLKRLHYIEGFNYTTERKDVKSNISLSQGLFIVTVSSKDHIKDIDEKYWKPMKMKINRTDTGKVVVYTYSMESRNKFDFVLKKLMSTGIIFNIFE